MKTLHYLRGHVPELDVGAWADTSTRPIEPPWPTPPHGLPQSAESKSGHAILLRRLTAAPSTAREEPGGWWSMLRSELRLIATCVKMRPTATSGASRSHCQGLRSRLTALKPTPFESVGVLTNRTAEPNCTRRRRTFEFGLWVHADELRFVLDGRYERFERWSVRSTAGRLVRFQVPFVPPMPSVQCCREVPSQAGWLRLTPATSRRGWPTPDCGIRAGTPRRRADTDHARRHAAEGRSRCAGEANTPPGDPLA